MPETGIARHVAGAGALTRCRLEPGLPRVVPGVAGRFWAGLRGYTQQHWGRSVVPADFQASMEQAYGKSREPFFQRWTE